MIDMTYDESESKLRSGASLQTPTELQQRIRQQNELLARLAHELRNPIAPITHAVQLMEMLGLDEDAEELRRVIARQVDQLTRLVDSAMEISRLNRGKMQLQIGDVDLANVIQAAASHCSAVLSEREQSLQINCPKGIALVKADARRLTQALGNLLNNSSKSSDRGSEIQLNASVQGSQAVICIRDFGAGISPEHLASIFQMFQADAATTERGSAGLGVGLFLTKAIIELHGGSICAESEGQGCGSLFTIGLPLADFPVIEENLIENSNFSSDRKFRILVVDDQRAMRFVLTQLLEKMGQDVESVESAFKALQRIETFSPDIVISDIFMPDMDGYELAIALRKRSEMKHAMLVALTGSDEESARVRAIQSGFDEHLIKPVGMDRLRHLIARRANFNSRP